MRRSRRRNKIVFFFMSLALIFAILLLSVGLGFIVPSSFGLNLPFFTSSVKKPSTELSDLTPNIAPYLHQQGTKLAVAVYIPQSKHYYMNNASQTPIMASTAKVPILLTMLHMAEVQNRFLSNNEVSLLTKMIKVSDNDAAQSIYDKVGDDDGVNSYLKSIGITDMHMDELFGYSTTTPVAVVNLLAKLQQGTILTNSGRTFAMNLMSDVSSDQQYGIGLTAPINATYIMKDGWVQGPDNKWTTGSIGIVTMPSSTYIIAIYAQNLSSKEDGFSMMNTVCDAVAKRLTSKE
jgi:beta-lactamase class A